MATQTESAYDAPQTGADVWLAQIRAFAVSTLREFLRNKAAVFWSVAFPAGFYLLTIALFIDTSTIPAEQVGFVKGVTALGFGMFGALVVCLNAFAGRLVDDLDDGRYEQFRAFPVAPTADLLGRMFAGALFAVVSFGVVIGVSVLTGAEYALRAPWSPLVIAVAFLAFAAVWMVVAVFLAVAVPDAKYANIIAISVVMLSHFLTGYNGTLPGMFAADPALLNLLPNTLGTRVVAYHLLDVSSWTSSSLTPPVPPAGIGHLGLLVGYGAVALLVGSVGMHRIVYERGWPV
jgi:ABC-2 type transport system permease protein